MAAVTTTMIHNDLMEVKVMLHEHDKILIRGNGEPSLREQFRSLDKKITEYIAMQAEKDKQSAAYRDQRIREQMEERRWWKRAIVSAIIGALVPQIILGFVYYPLLEKLVK